MTDEVQDRPAKLPLATWMREGLRAGLFLRPRIGAAQPGPLQLLALLALAVAIDLVLGRLEIAGPAQFSLQIWLAEWWTSAVMVFLLWAALRGVPAAEGAHPAGLAAWFGLWVIAVLPSGLVAQGLGIARAQEVLPEILETSAWAAWAVYLGLLAWLLAAGLWLSHQFGVRGGRLAGLGLAMLALFFLQAWQFQQRPWVPDLAAAEEEGPPPLQLSQETFEAQQALWQRQAEALAPERPGVTDVYGIVFAPYATEDVFLREGALVAATLAERFDAEGRVLHLANHISTTSTHPWATPLNLKRAIEAVAARMDREHDLLVLYLTSHGASNFQLASSHWPLHMENLSPGELRTMLDEAGVRNRVIMVSACYSGGWVGPLGGDRTLVMTAADANQTSYGCGRKSELTFFGRALFAEQLRKTHSFEQAFAAAVPVIRQREEEARKPDGFSNPQIEVGAAIRPVLKALEERLQARAKP
jgi:hypothetical protein